MTEFAEIWSYLAAGPLLWLTVTLAAYVVGDGLAKAARRAALANPVLIAVILGPLAESSLRSAMNNSQNNPLTLVSTPITITLYTLLLIVIGISVYNKVRVRPEAERAEDAEAGAR